MYVDPDLRYAYIATPRTGSNAIAKFLKDHGWQASGKHHDIADDLSSFERVAASVRNHHDTIRSYWDLQKYAVSKCANCGYELREPFEVFVPRFLRRDVTYRVAQLYHPSKLFGPFTRHATHTIRLEYVIDDLRSTFPDAFKTKPRLEKVNVTKWPKKGPPEYTEENWDLVTEAFEDEIRELGYKVVWFKDR